MTDPIARLAEIKAKTEGHTPGPWEVWTGCSWRRIGRVDQSTHVITPTNHPVDHHPDLSGKTEDLELAAAGPELETIATTLAGEVGRLRNHIENIGTFSTSDEETFRRWVYAEVDAALTPQEAEHE